MQNIRIDTDSYSANRLCVGEISNLDYYGISSTASRSWDRAEFLLRCAVLVNSPDRNPCRDCYAFLYTDVKPLRICRVLFRLFPCTCSRYLENALSPDFPCESRICGMVINFVLQLFHNYAILSPTRSKDNDFFSFFDHKDSKTSKKYGCRSKIQRLSLLCWRVTKC